MMILLHGKHDYDHSVLNVKIDAELKEKLRHYAEVNNENLGTATEKLLLLAFQIADSAGEAGFRKRILIASIPKRKLLH
jgi:hypothetical protein